MAQETATATSDEGATAEPAPLPADGVRRTTVAEEIVPEPLNPSTPGPEEPLLITPAPGEDLVIEETPATKDGGADTHEITTFIPRADEPPLDEPVIMPAGIGDEESLIAPASGGDSLALDENGLGGVALAMIIAGLALLAAVIVGVLRMPRRRPLPQ
jgi:hypothetical protein